MMTWLRSIGAVFVGLVAGMLVVFALTYAAALVFFSGDLTVAPTPSYLVVNLAYSFAAAMLAGWLAARLASRAPFMHAVAVAVIMFVLSLGGGEPPPPGVPTWYGPVLTVFMPLGALLGGWLYQRAAQAKVLATPTEPYSRPG